MRGADQKQEAMFSYISPQKRVPAHHPLRRAREIVDAVLPEMPPHFARVVAPMGRPSIAPERVLRDMPDEHFTLDGTLMEAWPVTKPFVPGMRNRAAETGAEK